MNLRPSRLKNMYSQIRKSIRRQSIQLYFKQQRIRLTNSLSVQLLVEKIMNSKYLTNQIFNQFILSISTNNLQEHWSQKINQSFYQKCLSYSFFQYKSQQKQKDCLDFNEDYLAERFIYKNQFQFIDILIILVSQNLLCSQNIKQKLWLNIVDYIKILRKSDFNARQQILIKYCFRVLVLIKALLTSRKIQYQFAQIIQDQFQFNLQNSAIVSLHQIVENVSQILQFFQKNQSIFFKSHTKFLEIIVLLSKLKHKLFPINKCIIFKDTIIHNTIKLILLFNLEESQQSNKKNNLNLKEQFLYHESLSEIYQTQFKFNCFENCYQFLIFLAIYSIEIKQENTKNQLIQKIQQQQDFYETVDEAIEQVEFWKINENLLAKILRVPNFLQKIKQDLLNFKISKKILSLLNILIDNKEVLQMLIHHDILATLTIILIKGKINIEKKQLKYFQKQNYFYQIFFILIKVLKLGSQLQDSFFQRVIRQYYTSKYFLNCIGQIIFGYPINSPNQWQHCSISRTKFSKSILQSKKIFQVICQLLQVMIEKYKLKRLVSYLEQSRNRKKNCIVD